MPDNGKNCASFSYLMWFLTALFALKTFSENIRVPLPHFRNKMFILKKMPQRNASIFTIFLEYENPHGYFCISFHFSGALS